jgi:hypothetical protein
MMGPERDRRYAPVTSMPLWIALASAPGVISTTSRCLPRWLGRDEVGKVRRLVGNLPVASSGVAAAVVNLILLALSWPDLDRTGSSSLSSSDSGSVPAVSWPRS